MLIHEAINRGFRLYTAQQQWSTVVGLYWYAKPTALQCLANAAVKLDHLTIVKW